MLYDFGVFVQQFLLLQLLLMTDVSVHCAIMFVDEFDNDDLGRIQRKSTKNYYSIIEQGDSTPFDSSKSSIGWDDLDPRKQTVGSSYSVIETSGKDNGPRHFAYSRREYDPASENWSEEEQPPPRRAGRKKSQIKFPRVRNHDYGRDEDEFNVPKKDVELIKKRPKKPKSSINDVDSRPAHRQRKKKQKPKKHNFEKSAALSSASNEEDHEEPSAPLLGAGSGSLVSKKSKGNDDLKKSSSYRSGDDGDSYEEGYDTEKHYDKEGGKKYVEAHKSEAGDKAHKGYKKHEAFDAAEEDKHDKEEKKAEVAEKHGVKKGHLEQEKQFGEGYEGNAGEKGISVTKKGGHKKGHKKSGFHKVHHKDEYKKDEVFYDEDHDLDEHEEHAHEQEKHAKEKGGAAKKAVIDSKYHEGHGEKKGLVDKGHNFEEATGHKKEKSEEAHHDSHSEFDKKGGVKEGEKHGHAEGGGKKGGYSGHDYF
ncbi:hypothetical protein V9T40_001171 [Parthenolecanium corni]|uniref:Uncharacterized protein n=1 Tax=Parthenolecanium corni TaxID=536013 RepID=A0AAN9Y151_9HEMI